LSKWVVKQRPNKTAKIPYGYRESDDSPLVLVADEAIALLVEQALDYLEEGNSSRKTAEWLTKQAGMPISHQGLLGKWKILRGKGTEKPSKRLRQLEKDNKSKKPKTKAEKTIAAAKQTQLQRRT
jgi:hypothetical protein